MDTKNDESKRLADWRMLFPKSADSLSFLMPERTQLFQPQRSARALSTRDHTMRCHARICRGRCTSSRFIPLNPDLTRAVVCLHARLKLDSRCTQQISLLISEAPLHLIKGFALFEQSPLGSKRVRRRFDQQQMSQMDFQQTAGANITRGIHSLEPVYAGKTDPHTGVVRKSVGVPKTLAQHFLSRLRSPRH